MQRPLSEIVHSYDANVPLERAHTIPASWYLSSELMDLERRAVFARAWQPVARVEQVAAPGQYACGVLASGDPVVVVRGRDAVLRGFFNVCRHHAAAVVTLEEGSAEHLRCPYHGWTYSLEGELKGTPDFGGVCDFDRSANGLVAAEIAQWEKWIFMRSNLEGAPAASAFSPALRHGASALGLERFTWFERRHYALDCNWKVFVDNYLDGGYHVPHLHKGLDSVLDSAGYTVELGERFCVQSSPIVTEGADQATAAVRDGDRAFYYWIYPNFMINCYGNAMDTNLVVPNGPGRTDVIFDFFFTDVSEAALAGNLASIRISEQIQDEDVSVCRSVQRGLMSRAYGTGRLSVRREAGEHLFHRLLYQDLSAGIGHL